MVTRYLVDAVNQCPGLQESQLLVSTKQRFLNMKKQSTINLNDILLCFVLHCCGGNSDEQAGLVSLRGVNGKNNN